MRPSVSYSAQTMDLQELLNAQPARLSMLSSRGRGGRPVQPAPAVADSNTSLGPGFTPPPASASATAARPAAMPVQQQPPQSHLQMQMQPRVTYGSADHLAESHMRSWERAPHAAAAAAAESYRGPPPQPAQPAPSAAVASTRGNHAATHDSSHSSCGFLSPTTRNIASSWQIAPAAAPAPPPAAAAVVPGLYSEDESFDLSIIEHPPSSFASDEGRHRHPASSSSSLSQALQAHNAQLDAQRRFHAEHVSLSGRSGVSSRYSALPPPLQSQQHFAHPRAAFVAAPAPAPASRYLRPEDDPDEDVQVSSDEGEEPIAIEEPARRFSSTRRSPTHSSTRERHLERRQRSRTRSPLPRESPPRRRHETRTTRNSPRYYEEEGESEDRPFHSSTFASSTAAAIAPHGSISPRNSSLSRVYELLDENQSFYSSRTGERSVSSSTRPAASNNNSNSSSTTLFHAKVRDGRMDVLHNEREKHMQLDSSSSSKLVGQDDEPALHLHVHMHPSPPRKSATLKDAKPSSSSSATAVPSALQRSVSFQDGDVPVTTAAAAASKTTLKPSAAPTSAHRNEGQQQHPLATAADNAGAISMDDLRDSNMGARASKARHRNGVIEDEKESKHRDGEGEEEEEDERENHAAHANKPVHASMMSITRAAVLPAALQQDRSNESARSLASEALRTLKKSSSSSSSASTTAAAASATIMGTRRVPKPLKVFEPSSSYRRPGPGGAAGGAPLAPSPTSSSSTSASATMAQQGSDVGIFMPSSSQASRSGANGGQSSSSSCNKLALNSARAALAQSRSTAHTSSVLARLNSVARSSSSHPRPSQCVTSLFGPQAARDILLQETQALQAQHAHILYRHERAPSPPPTHPPRTSPLKRQPPPSKTNNHNSSNNNNNATVAAATQGKATATRSPTASALPSSSSSRSDPAMVDLTGQLAFSTNASIAQSMPVSISSTPRGHDGEAIEFTLEPRMKDASTTHSPAQLSAMHSHNSSSNNDNHNDSSSHHHNRNISSIINHANHSASNDTSMAPPNSQTTLLLQSLLALSGMQQDPRSRELAQTLLATLVQQQQAQQRGASTSATAAIATDAATTSHLPNQPQLQPQSQPQPQQQPEHHRRQSSSVSFADSLSSEMTSGVAQQTAPPSTTVLGVATAAATAAASFLNQPPPHPLGSVVSSSSRRGSASSNSSSTFSSSVSAPTSSTLFRERSLSQAQQLMSSRPKATQPPPLTLLLRKRSSGGKGSSGSVAEDDEEQQPPRAAGASAGGQKPTAASIPTSAQLSLHRIALLRKVRDRELSADSLHAKRVRALAHELRQVRHRLALTRREVEEDQLYELYVRTRQDRLAAAAAQQRQHDSLLGAEGDDDDDAAAAGDGSSSQLSLEDDASLIHDVGQMELDPALVSSDPRVRDLEGRLNHLTLQVAFAKLEHATDRTRVRAQAAEQVATEINRARAIEAFKEWKTSALRTPPPLPAAATMRGARNGAGVQQVPVARARPMPSHEQAREHMEVWRAGRALKKLHSFSARSSVLRGKLASLLSNRHARTLAALYHTWRARVLSLYEIRMQEDLAAQFARRMRRARDFRTWRTRASRAKFVAWQLRRAMETQAQETMQIQQAQEQEQMAIQQQANNNAQRLLMPGASAPAPATTTAAAGVPAATIASSSGASKGFKRDTAASLAKQRLSQLQQQQQQHVLKLKKARMVTPAAVPKRKPAPSTTTVAVATPLAAAAAAAAPAPTPTAIPVQAPSPLEELDQIESEAPRFSKYFLAEVRRELLESAASGRLLQNSSSSSSSSTAGGSSRAANAPVAGAATVAIAEALARASSSHPNSGSASASALVASSSWLPSLAHSFRSHVAPFHLDQLRWIRAQVGLRLGLEAGVGWVVSKFQEQLVARAEELQAQVARRGLETQRTQALRGAKVPNSTHQQQQQQQQEATSAAEKIAAQLARMPSVVPMCASAPQEEAIERPETPVNVAAAVPSPTPAEQADAVAAAAAIQLQQEVEARHAEQLTREVQERERLIAEERQRQEDEENRQREEEARAEAEYTALEHYALRERSAMEDAWIQSQLERAAAETFSAETSSSHISFDPASAAMHGLAEQQPQPQQQQQSTSQSVADWLREHDLPNPDEEEAVEEAEEEGIEVTEEQVQQRVQQFDIGVDASSFVDLLQPASLLPLSSPPSEDHHLHVHHFSAQLEQQQQQQQSPPSSQVASLSSAVSSEHLLHQLQSMNTSIVDIQNSLSLSASFHRQQQLTATDAFEQQPIKRISDVGTNTSSNSSSDNSSSHTSNHLPRVAPVSFVALPLPLPSLVPRGGGGGGDNHIATVETPSEEPPIDPLYEVQLRRRANLQWAMATFRKVFRAWLTRVLLQHLERKAGRQTNTEEEEEEQQEEHQKTMDLTVVEEEEEEEEGDRSQLHSSATDPELSAALSEPSSSSAPSSRAHFSSSLSSSPPRVSGGSFRSRGSLAQLVYPELLRLDQVKHALERSIHEAERQEVEQQERSRASSPQRKEPVRERVRFAEEGNNKSVVAAPAHEEEDEPPLDDLMFAHFKRASDRKAQLQLESILLKTNAEAAPSRSPKRLQPQQQPQPEQRLRRVADDELPSSSAHHLLRPTDLQDMLAGMSESQKRGEEVSVASTAATKFVPDGVSSVAAVQAPSAATRFVRPPAPAPGAAFQPLPLASSSLSAPLAAFTDLSFSPGSSFGFASDALLPSFDSSTATTVMADPSSSSSSSSSFDASADLPQQPTRQLAAAAAHSRADLSAPAPPSALVDPFRPPPRPLPRLAFNFSQLAKPNASAQRRQ